MASDDSNYKRVDDQKWRDSLNEWRAAQSASEVAQNDRLDEHDEEIEGVKEFLHGKESDRDDNGLAGDVEKLKDQMRHVNGVLWPSDPLSLTSKVGMVADVRRLVNKEDKEERRADRWWKGIGPIVVAIVTSAALVLTNLDRILPSIKKFWKQEVVSDSRPQKKRTGKTSKRRSSPVREVPTEATDGANSEDVPDGRSGYGRNAE